ncbi:MAG: hypothetical protein ACJATA_002181 [Sphingobacteriales bacterium]|jgi:hypothetical protein
MPLLVILPSEINPFKFLDKLDSTLKQDLDHTVSPYPWHRKLIHDATRLGIEKPFIKALTEADITEARAAIKCYNKGRTNKISLTSYLIKCIAKTVKKYPQMQSYKSWRQKIWSFNTVDLMVPIEIVYGGEKALKHYVIRNAESKSCSQIFLELADTQKINSFGLYPEQYFFLRLPWFLRKIGYRILYSSPKNIRKQIGTILYSPLHMYFKNFTNPLLGIGIPTHTAGVYTSGIVKKGDSSKISLTVMVDHNMVDGNYLSQCTNALIKEIENGYVEIINDQNTLK